MTDLTNRLTEIEDRLDKIEWLLRKIAWKCGVSPISAHPNSEALKKVIEAARKNDRT
jgi:hypothetical protein